MAIAQVNLDALYEVVTHEPLAVAGKAFGAEGVSRIKNILRFLRKSSRFITVHERSSFTVFSLPSPDQKVSKERTTHAEALRLGVTVLGSVDELVVEVREDGSAFVWRRIPADIQAIVNAGVVYNLQQGVETFSIGGTTLAVPKVIECAVSQFCLNSFTNLREALLAYRDSMARTSKCHLIREVWADSNRLWFVTKPEYRLRRALHNYLYSYLRHDEICLREEQNVDDSHPVDIKIVWRMENRSAIIEVKWLGKSFNPKTRKVTQTHTDGRARKGARQLAEYLESHRQEAAHEDTRGYLVVFDGRRKGLKPSVTETVREKGFHFDRKEISFEPAYHKIRQDFEEPIRMFLEPVCT
jgi:hypothetical protein